MNVNNNNDNNKNEGSRHNDNENVDNNETGNNNTILKMMLIRRANGAGRARSWVL